MNSKNNLTITGVIVNEVTISAEQRIGHLTLAHYFGRQNPPLYLNCVFFGKRFDEIISLDPRRGDTVNAMAYLRPKGNGIEAVLKGLSITEKSEFYRSVVFEYVDDGKKYVIPDEKCVIDEFRVEGNILILSTGEEVSFNSEEGAMAAWCHLDECFRSKGRSIFFQESTISYGIG